MRPGFDPHELASRYDVNCFSEDDWHTYSGRRTAKLLSRHLKRNKTLPERLLNAGSGVYDIGIPGWAETAVDLFDSPIQGRQNAIKGNIEHLQFGGGTFGAVVCVGEVLGYCDPQKVIFEFSRVLVPGGILVCDFASSRSFRRWFRREFGRIADLVQDEYNGSAEPVWIYDPRFILRLLRSSGFFVERVYGSHTWSAIARGLGVHARSATHFQCLLDWVPLPSNWADVTTIFAVRASNELRPP
jgi:SAM-dependent methyltransferase